MHNNSCAHCSEGVVAMSYDNSRITDVDPEYRFQIAFLKLAAISEILVVCGFAILAALFIIG
ncbi:MAG: hypothetical protein LUQ40_06470 [Methanomicrobiales archaeon]|nr:hypothetical protein [Methanomicrobiales archaeon]